NPTTNSCTVDTGSSVSLTAPDIAGYRFTGWDGTCGSTKTIMVTPTADVTCTAQYVQRYTIAAASGANGSVTAKVGDTTCPSNSGEVEAGTEVNLTATPASSSYRFSQWTGTGCTPSTDAEITLKNVNTPCTASFVRQYTIAATAGQNG